MDKTIDLTPYLESYPYEPVLPLWDSKTLLYDYQGKTTTLHRTELNLENPNPMESGSALSNVNWDSRSRWEMTPHENYLYYLGDEKNDEVINLYRLNMDTGEPEALTEVPYTYGFSFSDTKDRIAWLPRKAERPFITCLSTMAPDGSEAKEHVCDTPGATFTWNKPSWSPDGRGVVVRVNVDGQRERGNLAWIQWDQPKPIILTNPTQSRTSIHALAHWLDNNHFIYRSDESGFDAVGIYDLTAHTTQWLYTTSTSLTHSEVVELKDGTTRVLIIEHSPIQDRVILLDPANGAILDKQEVNGASNILGKIHQGQGLISLDSNSTPFQVHALHVSATSLKLTPWLALPDELQSKIVQCDVQAVQFPTFDLDPATQKTRSLHAFLYTPKVMGEANTHLVRVKSFYGGENGFSNENQIFCEAGVVTFSPAVRGSWGFGTEFYRLNDGDLGGDEIVDLFEAGRWLASQGYDEKKIGVYGRSHGGYATMRAMTFPTGTNGHKTVFPFAFGLADASFSDIVSFYENCNIPDWVVLEAGDPATEREKLLDRSPITHVDKLQAPLFMSHGENDNRVPVSGSRRMNESCQAAQKPCTYVEFPAQGHSVQGLSNIQKLYQARFSFLETLISPSATDE